jgi:RNA polymerase sigma-70 factor (ECF subfamily)
MEEEPDMLVVHAGLAREGLIDIDASDVDPTTLSAIGRSVPGSDRFPTRERPTSHLDRFHCERPPSLAPARAGHSDFWVDQFDTIVGPWISRLRRLARRILRSEDLADDAVQEALLCLWQEGQLPPNPEGWLVRSVIHRSLHMNRSRRRRRDHEQRASSWRSEHDPGSDPSHPSEVAELGRAIEAALSVLPDHLRTVFVLREVEQMDYESIAETLQVPVGTIRSRLHRAREALREALLPRHER